MRPRAARHGRRRRALECAAVLDAGRRALRAQGRLRRDHRPARRAGGRGVAGLGAVEHDVAAGAVPGRRPLGGRGGRSGLADVHGGGRGLAWQAPTAAPQLPAEAYCFARRLRREWSVPVGVVVRAAGGTSCVRWLPRAAARRRRWERRAEGKDDPAGDLFEAAIEPLSGLGAARSVVGSGRKRLGAAAREPR